MEPLRKTVFQINLLTENNTKTLATFYFAIMVALMLGMAFYKAFVGGFTHDESYTFNYFISDSFIDIISLKHAFTNNHILNTLFMKWSSLVFGISEWVLRLPSTLAFGFAAIGLFKLLKKNQLVLPLALIIVLASNSLFDFFSLARGYALSIAFMIWALHFAIRFIGSHTKTNSFGFHAMAILAGLSQFTTLSFYAAAGISLTLVIYLKEPKNFKSNLAKLLWPIIITVIMFYEPLRRVQGQDFDFGAKMGIHETLIGTFNHLLNGIETPFWFILIVALAIVIVPLGIQFLRQKKIPQKLSFTAFTLLTLTLVLMALNQAFSIDYPIGRLALYIHVLFAIHVVFFIEWVTISFAYQKKAMVFITLATIGAINFGLKYQTNYFGVWAYDRFSEKALIELEKQLSAAEKENMVNLEIDWVFEPTLNYYRVKNNYQWLKPLNRDGFNVKSSQYIYAYKTNLNNVDFNQFKVIANYKQPNICLLKRK